MQCCWSHYAVNVILDFYLHSCRDLDHRVRSKFQEYQVMSICICTTTPISGFAVRVCERNWTRLGGCCVEWERHGNSNA